MSRINTNVSSLIAQRVLNKNNSKLNTSLERLSTGLKINSGADDPAGLIASENLRAEKEGISQAIDNAERAGSVIGTAEGGLSEVSNLLTNLQGLISEAANSGGLSTEEKAANQLQVDSILSTINRLATQTSFNGAKLLDGSLDYTTSGVTASTIDNLRVNSARIPEGATQSVVVQVTASSQRAVVTHSGTTTTATTIEIAGLKGVEQLSFATSTTISSMKTAINALKENTGISAIVSGTKLVINSTDYGSKAFVSVKALNGTFQQNVAKDTGTDAVVKVNGAAAQADGVAISLRTGNLDVEFDLDATFNKALTKTFNITGGGATFSLGSKVNTTGKASLGIGSVSTGSLGNASLGYLNTLATGQVNNLEGKNLIAAQKIVDKSIKQVSQLRGRLGAFQKYTIGSTVNSLGVAFENAAAAESAIRDADFAEETANLTRSQILSQAASSVLSQANAAPQAALQLLQ